MPTSNLDDVFQQIITDPVADPRPLYDRMRETAPVYRTPFGFWVTWAYKDSFELLRNQGQWAADPAKSLGGAMPHPDSYTMQVWAKTVVVSDAPQHSRLRRQMQPFFTPAAIEKLRDKVTTVVKERLTALGGKDTIEFRFEFAELLPTRIILELLGISQDHLHTFADVSESLAQAMEPDVTEETLTWADSTWRTAAEIVLATADERRSDPAPDLMTALVRSQEGDDGLTDEELIAMALIMSVAGQETTGQVLCSGLYQLVRNPVQLTALRADRSKMQSAVEETLRFETATRSSGPRFALSDTELHGTKIAKGETVFVMLHAANHDPEEFDRPHEFRIDRTPNRHLGLGSGPHHCLGSALARLELGIVWNALMDGYRHIEVVEEDDNTLAWKPRFMVRGLERLPLRVDA